MTPLRGRLVLDCTAEQFAAACDAGTCTIDVVVVDVASDIEAGPHVARRVLLTGQRQRTKAEFEDRGGAGAPLRLHLAPRQEVSDGR